jgi:hypothetical protein
MNPPRSLSLPLWPLPLLAALLPLAAALAALFLSIGLELVPACNPFFEGCTSISRAGRHGLPNHIFRALMLPAATLQAIVWVLVARWLAGLAEDGKAPRSLAPLGVLAGVALVLYGGFLGTEGMVYRMLRQYGTAIYFGFTCICALLAAGALQRAVAAGRLAARRGVLGVVLALGAALVLLGIANAVVATFFGEEMKDRIENATEWWGALIFQVGFAALALLWWRLDVRAGLSEAAPR